MPARLAAPSRQRFPEILEEPNSSKEENEALDKVEHGLRMADAGKIAWGAADLLKLQERMAAEPRAWTAAQISEIQPHYDRARQAVIMHFREWLDRQAPPRGHA